MALNCCSTLDSQLLHGRNHTNIQGGRTTPLPVGEEDIRGTGINEGISFLGARADVWIAEKLHHREHHAGRFCPHCPHSPPGDPRKGQQQNGRQDNWNLQQTFEGPTSIVDTGETPSPGDGDQGQKKGLRSTRLRHDG